MIKLNIVLLSLLFTLNALSSIKNHYCETKYIHKVKSQIDDKTNRTFDFLYQKTFFNKSFPTFIVIPGGPGGSSIGNYNPQLTHTPQKEHWGLPFESNVIYTDPRSIGCNNINHLPNKTLTTHNVANDILNILKKEKLQNYVIIAHSYGTVVATTLATLINKTNLTKPSAYALSGTLGHFFKKGRRYDGYNKAWKNLRKSFPIELKRLFPNLLTVDSTFKYPLGIPKNKWISFIANGLVDGIYYLNGKEIYNLRKKLYFLISKEPKKIAILKKEVLATVSDFGTELDTADSDFFNEIYCNELEDSNLECIKHGYKKFLRPYNSSHFSIDAPIIYFHGEQDPSVPLAQGSFHLNNQHTPSLKMMITMPLGGHTTAMLINDCKNWFWKKILNNKIPNQQEIAIRCPGELKLLL